MPTQIPSTLPLFLFMGVVFGGLAAVAAYLISYNEYRQQMLRPDQNPRKMALSTAVMAYAFFIVASAALAFLLRPN